MQANSSAEGAERVDAVEALEDWRLGDSLSIGSGSALEAGTHATVCLLSEK